jgi:hypothetical protein
MTGAGSRRAVTVMSVFILKDRHVIIDRRLLRRPADVTKQDSRTAKGNDPQLRGFGGM